MSEDLSITSPREGWSETTLIHPTGGVEKSEDAYSDNLFQPLLRPQTPGLEQQTYDTFVTDESCNDAVLRLSDVTQRDAGLRDTLENFTGDSKWSYSPRDFVDAIRSNQEVRSAVAHHYVAKLEHLIATDPNRFGSQIINNTPKMPHGPTADGNISSRENVVLLALAKLDGSFNERAPGSHVKEPPVVETGEHRTAADYLLAA